MTALAATAAHDPMPFVRSMAVSALGKTQDRRVMRPLIEATTDRDGRVSTAAEVAISEIHEPWRIPFLVRALRHTSACVRVIAVSNLWDVKDPTVMRALLSLVEDEDRSVRRALAVCPELPRGRKPPMAQVALGELSAARAKSRRCAAAMLGWLKWGPAVDALTGALHDRDEGVVICAVTALGSIGDPRAVDALTELLSDSRQAVRRAARRALKDLGITRPSQRPRQPRLPFPGDRPRW